MEILEKEQIRGILTPIFWVFRIFGTREGYTRLAVWNIVINLAAGIAYFIHGHPLFSVVPFTVVMLNGWVLNESYKTNRQPVDPFVGFLISILWTTTAFLTIFDNPTFGFIPLLLIGGAVLTMLVIWEWVVMHVEIDTHQFLTTDEEKEEYHGIR